MPSLDRDQLLELLLRDLEQPLAERPELRAFAVRVAEAIIAALTEHERKRHTITPEFGEEERNG
ncbi:MULTISPECIES: hypothetical protein [Thermomicrobium]|jgi:hypothetical protein|uniref:IS256 family transposase n=1 Tax=Thermomicrobium roseum (strain ATCC 27502 / DSM 5159 / P-2) TaxID=309801 RepID=B9L2N7_THERP|nr:MULTISPECIES: hypothetical protein [Thermomicrobium]ACM05604.1 hypothetical protein trd_1441 [Thermomicrobium roseum DSM 5159]MBO9306646.1 hypothetical protein [Thermomicrobium sp.]MBO9350458.1 hypothetical protein [Thermomicrobium sp.]MBO9405418.1 hypothetical protein [Thermomicrobium sp.]